MKSLHRLRSMNLDKKIVIAIEVSYNYYGLKTKLQNSGKMNKKEN